jgi:DNA-binding transcriptional MerR regulator
MKNKQEKSLWTVSEIAKHAGCARHRVLYLIQNRGISMACKIGNARVYTKADRDRIAKISREIDAEMKAGGLR